MQFTTLFFDLDATLYPASNGLWEQIRIRIYKYMHEVVGITESTIPLTRDHYWSTYGTTLEGLRIHHQVDPEHYLSYVHDIPLEEYLQKDSLLKNQLNTLPQDLWVFTNADFNHASRVLKILGIETCFSGIVDLIALNYVVKPNPKAYQVALKLAGEDDPTRCVLFDDLLPNLRTAKELGFTTSLVGNNGQQEDSVDYFLASIHDLESIMPVLRKDPDN
jgi:putative hydrolase of the HAD superfamily